MATIEALAPAKINLALHVTGQRDDGYHLLDSLVVFADLGDTLWLTPGDVLSLRVTGPFAQGVPADSRNLVWQAAELAGFCGAIRLEKTLPHGAGIGGGSADAAAVLRCAGAHVGPAQAAALGADVPVCLLSRPQRMGGIGDALQPAGPLPDLWLVLVNPGIEVPTARVFAALTEKTHPPLSELPAGPDLSAFAAWLSAQRNDLQAPALALAPVIGEVLDALSDARVARMSGSGATCFGLYPGRAAAESAARRIAAARPGWWVRAAQAPQAGPLS